MVFAAVRGNLQQIIVMEDGSRKMEATESIIFLRVMSVVGADSVWNASVAASCFHRKFQRDNA